MMLRPLILSLTLMGFCTHTLALERAARSSSSVASSGISGIPLNLTPPLGLQLPSLENRPNTNRLLSLTLEDDTPGLQLSSQSLFTHTALTNDSLWNNWYLLGERDHGLRTAVGLGWQIPQRRSDNFRQESLGELASENVLRTKSFIGLGWTQSGNKLWRGTRWQVSADIGASFTSRDCSSLQNTGCITGEGFGLRPSAHNDGIRWAPFISIGASIQY